METGTNGHSYRRPEGLLLAGKYQNINNNKTKGHLINNESSSQKKKNNNRGKK